MPTSLKRLREASASSVSASARPRSSSAGGASRGIQAVHRLVQPRGLVGDHAGGLGGSGVALAQPGVNGARQRADRGHRLRELVSMQLTGDGAALGLSVGLEPARELAALLERCARPRRRSRARISASIASASWFTAWPITPTSRPGSAGSRAA